MSDSIKVRLDKWLWAARFFKTRSLAKTAIEGGKVQYNGIKGKVSRTVELGAILTIRQGISEKTVTVDALSDKRRGAPEAAMLYTETPDSIKKRMDEAEKRRLFREADPNLPQRPNKKQRRQIIRFQRHDANSSES